MRRSPNIRTAAGELAFLVLALIAGWAGAAWSYFALLLAGTVFVWWWTRRAALAAMPLRRRITQSALALVMLVVVLALFYWIGRMLGGHN